MNDNPNAKKFDYPKSLSYYGFIGISSSITLDRLLKLSKFQFDRKNLLELSKILIDNKIPTLSQNTYKLLKKSEEKKIFLEEQRNSYLIDYAYSKILDFTQNSEVLNSPNTWWTKRALRINKKELDSSPIFNAFLISTKFNDKKENNIQDFSNYSTLYTVTYDIMLLVSLRQWELFLDSYLFRTYDIFLPPAKILKSSGNDKENESYFIGIPYISIRKKANQKKGKLSKTVSISIIFIPTNKDFKDRRSMNSDEMREMTSDSTRITLENSPLKDFIKDILNSKIFNKLSKKKELIEKEIDMEMPIRHLFKIIAFLIHLINSKKFNETKWSLIANRLYDSFQYLKLLDVDYGSFEGRLRYDLRNFYKGSPESDRIRELLNILVAPQHQLNKRELNIIDFRSLMVKDPIFLDSTLNVFYNPFDQVDVAFQLSYLEEFPKDSIKWSLSWHMKLIQSLSVLISLKNDYYYILEHYTLSSSILSKIEDEMLRDLDDFYDLEIRMWAYSYRMQFERAKELLGIDMNIEKLKEKVSTIRTIVNTNNQTKLSKSIRNLTWLLIILTFILFTIEFILH